MANVHVPQQTATTLTEKLKSGSSHMTISLRSAKIDLTKTALLSVTIDLERNTEIADETTGTVEITENRGITGIIGIIGIIGTSETTETGIVKNTRAAGTTDATSVITAENLVIMDVTIVITDVSPRGTPATAVAMLHSTVSVMKFR